MGALATDATELDELLRKVGEVEDLVTPPRSTDEVGEAPLAQRRADWYHDVENALLDLSSSLPQGTQDYEARKLFEFLIELRRAIDDDPEARDEQLRVELATRKLSDVIGRIERRLTEAELDDPRRAASFVLELLGATKVGDVAELLGVSTKTVGAWRAGKPVARNVERVVLVAQLLELLRTSMTPSGLVMWFHASREQLDGATPLAVLDDDLPQAREQLSRLALQAARGQLAG